MTQKEYNVLQQEIIAEFLSDLSDQERALFDFMPIESTNLKDLIAYAKQAGVNTADLREQSENLEYKRDFEAELEKKFREKAPILTFPNGDYMYVNYDPDKEELQTGRVTNAGFGLSSDSVKLKVEFNEGLNANLDWLYMVAIDEHPEFGEMPEEYEYI